MSIGPVWVIGAGGLLGGAVRRLARAAYTSRIDWSTTDSAVTSLAAGLRGYLAELAGGDPVIMWCAGAGVPHSPAAVFEQELAEFSGLLTLLTNELPADQLGRTTIFLASSAGAVYAGVESPPYTEASAVRPLAAYGENKLLLEAAARDFAARTGARAAIGRISNLYGPGQNLAKAQGLISVLLDSALSHRPVSIYVSLDTIRDYIFVDDAARLALAMAARVAGEPAGTTVMKILASGRRTTIATLLGVCRMVVGRAPLIIQGASPHAKVQARDLSMSSGVWTDLEGPMIGLEDGASRVYADLQLRHWAAAS